MLLARASARLAGRLRPAACAYTLPLPGRSRAAAYAERRISQSAARAAPPSGTTPPGELTTRPVESSRSEGRDEGSGAGANCNDAGGGGRAEEEQGSRSEQSEWSEGVFVDHDPSPWTSFLCGGALIGLAVYTQHVGLEAMAEAEAARAWPAATGFVVRSEELLAKELWLTTVPSVTYVYSPLWSFHACVEAEREREAEERSHGPAPAEPRLEMGVPEHEAALVEPADAAWLRSGFFHAPEPPPPPPHAP
eukprot:tig00001336_g8242.t1